MNMQKCTWNIVFLGLLSSYLQAQRIPIPSREEYKTNTGNIILFIDQGERDIKVPWDAIIYTFLYALNQEAAPILLSNNIWNVFADARYDFHEKSKIDMTPENKFKKFLDSVNKKLVTIDVTKPYDKSNIAKNIIADFQALNNFKSDKKIQTEVLCYMIPDDWGKWNIYKNNTFHLLIPKRYISEQAQKRQLPDLFKFFQVFDAITKRLLTTPEIMFGLKTNNMLKVTIEDPYNLPTSSAPSWRSNIRKALDDTFVNNQDKVYVNNVEVKIDKMTTQEKNLFLSWTIYLDGHGNKLSLSSEIIRLQKQIQEQHAKIGFIRTPEKFPKLASLYKTFRSSIDQYKIAGMNTALFIDFLKFLQNKINTDILVYSSCFAGGISKNNPLPIARLT